MTKRTGTVKNQPGTMKNHNNQASLGTVGTKWDVENNPKGNCLICIMARDPAL